jgi:predicted amidophosphoribosyltransferase
LPADEQLRAAIKVVSPKRIADAQVLVYDDVFTTGITPNTVAGVLKANGAIRVYGVSLVRAPFRRRHN